MCCVCVVFYFVSSCKEANALYFVLQVNIKKSTFCQLLTSLSITTRRFVDVILLKVFLDLFYRMNLLCFANHLNSLLLIFRSFVPIFSFCSYAMLMPKRMHLIQKIEKKRSNSNLKHFSFFVFNFNLLNKFYSTPPGY